MDQGLYPGLVAIRVLAAGEQIVLPGEIVGAPTYQTIRATDSAHFLSPFVSLLNHACDPNVEIGAVEWVTPKEALLTLNVLRAVPAHTEITFDYVANNEPMVRPFLCRCGADNCRGWIGEPE